MDKSSSGRENTGALGTKRLAARLPSVGTCKCSSQPEQVDALGMRALAARRPKVGT